MPDLIIETCLFSALRGGQPEGFGDWLFENVLGEVVFDFVGEYAEACRLARAFVAGSGIQILYVVA